MSKEKILEMVRSVDGTYVIGPEPPDTENPRTLSQRFISKNAIIASGVAVLGIDMILGPMVNNGKPLHESLGINGKLDIIPYASLIAAGAELYFNLREMKQKYLG